jgi:transcription initiation factor TFIID TATA-box-binding protein
VEVNKSTSTEHIFDSNVKISSIVYSMYLDQEIDIKKTSIIINNSKSYQGTRLFYKLNNPKVTVGMNKSGYIRSMGATTVEKAKEAITKTIQTLVTEQIISSPQILSERIENIVASGAFHNKLDLEFYADILPNNIYEPEQFPAIMYRPEKKIVCLLFASGKFVIVGAKSLDEIESTHNNLETRLNIRDK